MHSASTRCILGSGTKMIWNLTKKCNFYVSLIVIENIKGQNQQFVKWFYRTEWPRFWSFIYYCNCARTQLYRHFLLFYFFPIFIALSRELFRTLSFLKKNTLKILYSFNTFLKYIKSKYLMYACKYWAKSSVLVDVY